MSTITVQQITKIVSEQKQIKRELSKLKQTVSYYLADELAPEKIRQYEKISKSFDRGGPAVSLKSVAEIRKYFAGL